MIFKKIILLLSSIFIFNVGLSDKSEEEKDDKFIESKEKLENHHEPSLFSEENKSKNEYSYNGTTGSAISLPLEKNKNIILNINNNSNFDLDEITFEI